METKERIKKAILQVLPSSGKTSWWMIRVTVVVSLAMMLLKYFNILPLISDAISPVFKWFGLPGSAALAYLSGYFVNNYSAIAVMSTLGLDWRSTTILATMLLCSHSMVIETAVLAKTGASSARMVIVRTLSGLILGFLLNLILPDTGKAFADVAAAQWTLPFKETFLQWLWPTLRLCVVMTLIIYTLNIVQKLLNEFGIMDVIAGKLNPVMRLMGLPGKTAFLWIVANVVGLSYGAAAMLDEIEGGNIGHRDVLLLDSHICINHSNFEDLTLYAAIGGVWWVMLVIRLLMAIALTWEQKLEFYLSSVKK